MIIPQLSIIILCDRNDQVFIQCLESARIAHKILVFDYQSQNDWKKLKKKLNLHDQQLQVIAKNEKIKDFSEARNEAISLIKTPWLMFLDSDEVLSGESYPLILTAIAAENFAAYRVKRVDYYQGHYLCFAEAGNSYPIRLGKSKLIKFNRPIHELAMVAGKVAKSKILLKHYSHQNLTDFFSTIVDYASREAVFQIKNNSVNKIKIIGQMIFYPPLKFFYNYILRLGFLDLLPGFLYALMMSYHSLLVRIYIYEKIFKQQ